MSTKRMLPSETSNVPIRTSASLAAESTQEPDQIVYEKLTLTLADNGHAVYIEIVKDPETTEEVKYNSTPGGYIDRYPSFIKKAAEHFVKILKTPKLHLKQLVIEGIETLYDINSKALMKLLRENRELFKLKLSVERFKMEFKGNLCQVQPFISALQPKILKEVVIDSGCLCHETPEFVNLEQWKKAERLECFGGTNMSVEHWKHFKTIDIELDSTTKEELDEILETFLFLSTWERVSMEFRRCKVRRHDFFENLNTPDTTVIPGIVDNWVIEVPKMNHRVFVIFSEGTLHLLRTHWVEDRKKPAAIKTTFRKAKATLAEMPDVLKRNIAGRLDEMSRRSLGQTCRSFKHIVSTTESTYEKLTFTLADNRSAIFIELFIDAENRLELEFEQDPLGYTVRNPQEGWEQTVVYKQYRHGLKPKYDFIGGAVDHLLKIFTKKTVVKKLCIVTEDPSSVQSFLQSAVPEGADLHNASFHIMSLYFEIHTSNKHKLKKTLRNLLSKKQHLLKVQHHEIRHGEEYNDSVLIFKYLDPNVLERISIHGNLTDLEIEEVVEQESWKRAKELFCIGDLPAISWSHFPKTEISIDCLSAVKIEAILNALLVSTTWNNVLITFGYISDSSTEFLNRLEDQRPAASRIEDSKLIRIPGNPNQFINCHLINWRKISFTRVIQ